MRQYIKSRGDAEKILCEHKEYNFIAEAYTPWHALSIDAMIKKLLSQGVGVNALIVIREHPQTGWTIDESAFINNCSTYLFLPIEREQNEQVLLPVAKGDNSYVGKIAGLVLYYFQVFCGIKYQNKRIVYFGCRDIETSSLNFNLAHSNSFYQAEICYIEEGVAAYMGNLYRRTEIRSFADLRYYVRTIIFGKYIFDAIHQTQSVLTLKKNLLGELVPNKSMVSIYKGLFNSQSSLALKDLDKEEYENSVIICTTAWLRGEIKDDEDLRVLKEVCHSLIMKGYRLLLKTHPRDSFFKDYAGEMGCKYIDLPQFPLEYICSFARPKAVVSFSSTTLINPKIFWSIPVFCISDLLERSKIGGVYLKEIDCFKKTFSKFVSFPQSVSFEIE